MVKQGVLCEIPQHVTDLFSFFFSHPLAPYLSFHQETTAIQSLLRDTSQKRTSRFDPCLSLVLLFDSF